MSVDDMDLIRDLGRELEHEPPPTLVRQRRRLLDAAGRRRRFAGRRTLLGAVAAVTAAVILVPVAVLPGGEDRRPSATGAAGPSAGKAMNVLVLGADARRGGAFARSDTLLLVHVPADRKAVRAVSLPRDLLVRLPACERGGRTVAARKGLINTAFAVGGVSCAHKTVESLTAVRIDRTAVVEMDGFRAMVDALGGVRLTVPRPITDPKAGLRLRAGEQRLDGRQALAYVRSRYGYGDGSDLNRIKRQQQFMGALAREAKEQSRANPVRFARFLGAVAESVQITPRLDVGGLRELARGFGNDGAVRFDTVPVRPAASDPNRLELREAEAARLFALFKAGE